MEHSQSGEKMAALYRRYVTMVYQICLMLMKNVPDAEDATQTVFRKAMEHEGLFRDPEHEKAWLIVTARNECKNQLKHWWRTKRAGEEILQNLTWEQPSDGELWDLILPYRRNTGWCCISTTTRVTPRWKQRRSWGRTHPPFVPGWFRRDGN